MTTLDTSKPIETSPQSVLKEWCDYNGHMNVAYYSLAFENAGFEAQEMMGLGESYLRQKNASLFSLKNVYTYQQEVRQGDPLKITYRVMDYSPKLLHVLLEMFHAVEGFLSCYTEQLVAHVDMTTRKTAPMSTETLNMLEDMKNSLSNLTLPSGIGEPIAIKKSSRR
jgi:acyl-CoA thioester hydrolase